MGVKGRVALSAGHKCYAPYCVDVGAGDSKLTREAVAGVGYSFGWGDIVATWRDLDDEMKSGNPMENLTFSGPSISAVFRR